MNYSHGSFTANRVQSLAITHPPAPLMIIAGAGTGKTTTLIHRVSHLIRTGAADPESIVLLTFTEKASAELKQKIMAVAGPQSDVVTIATFHAFCNQLVREFSASPDAEKMLLNESDIAYLLLSRFDELTFLRSKEFCSNPVTVVINSLIPFFNRIRDELLTIDEIQQKLNSTRITEDNCFTLFPSLNKKTGIREISLQLKDLVAVYEIYQQWKNNLNVVDYADMILDCWKMLNDSPAILRQVRNKYRHLIIDEYQDNNFALNKIIHLIAGANRSITVVGDEDQCIYSFRGANYFNIRDFRLKYQDDRNAQEVTLEKNFRSTQEILDLANVSIAHDSNRSPKTLISANNKNGTKPVWHCGDKRQTLHEIPQLVEKYVYQEGKNYHDIAILCRTWNQVKDVAQVLQQKSIPVNTFTENFFYIPIIKEILAWGHALYDGARLDTGLFRILSQYIGVDFAQKFYRTTKPKNRPVGLEDLKKELSANTLTAEKHNKLEWIITTLTELRSLRTKKFADEMVWEILDRTKLLKETLSHYRYRERLTLLNTGYLLSLADIFTTRQSDKTLKHWLDYMDVLALDFKMPALQPHIYEGSGVRIMTIHKSKGLEFPVVMIPFLQTSSFPLNSRTVKQINTLPDSWYQWPKPAGLTPREEYINEERRIFYVGITRAQEKLHLFGPEKRQSVFLKEILTLKEKYLEQQVMKEIELPADTSHSTEIKERLIVELNRELAAHQYRNARSIVEGLQMIEFDGKLPPDHPYSYLTQNIASTPVNCKKSAGPLTLSASSIEEYERCSYKYRLSKIDKVPERKSKVQMEFGIIIHNVLEEFHKKKDGDLEFLLALLDKHWKQDAFEYLIREEEFKRQGKEILEGYYHFVRSNRPDIVAREARFDFVLEDINVRIIGKIDRIDQDGTQLVVTDYKTSVNKEPKAKNSLQLALYTEALKSDAISAVHGTAVKAQLHFLRHMDDPVDSHTFTADDLIQHRQKVKQVAEGIRQGIFVPSPNDFICRNCDYREFLCPAWEDK